MINFISLRHALIALVFYCCVFLTSGYGAQTSQAAKSEQARTFAPFSFAIISDPQIGMVESRRDRENFASVVTALNKLAPEAKPSLAFIAGDLVNQARDQTQLTLFNEVRKMFTMSVYPLPGNHDMTADGKHFDSSLRKNYLQNVGEDRLSLEYSGCLFIGLNSQLWIDGAEAAEEQFKWLEQQTRSPADYRHIFIIQHHPLFLDRADEADQYFNTPLSWRSKLLRLFERAKVAAVFTGHLHRNLSGSYHGMALITIPSSCLNFDGSAFGYSLINVTGEGFSERYIGVPGTTLPPIDVKKSTPRQ